MTFSLLPAIDLTDGHLGVYSASGPKRLDVFDGDPLAAARAYLAAGARWLHVVDMDLAFNGRATNVDLVRAIVEQSGEAPVQASGGVCTWEEVGAFLEAGRASSCPRRRLPTRVRSRRSSRGPGPGRS